VTDRCCDRLQQALATCGVHFAEYVQAAIEHGNCLQLLVLVDRIACPFAEFGDTRQKCAFSILGFAVTMVSDGHYQIDGGLAVLGKMNSAGSKSLLQAIATTVGHDGKVTAAEADLLRTICASLNCPLPPILGLVTAA